MAKSNLGRNSPTAQRRIEAKERSLKALELRKKGYRYEAIAKKLGYTSRGTAHKAVMRELELLAQECQEEAAKVRDLELQRLDDLFLAAWKAIAGGSESAIDRALRVSESRRKLLGLDAAEKHEHSGDITISLRAVDMGVVDE
ncbi:MAG: hypothetical protein PHX88_12665 [Methanoculleus horonobensis]|nr:hypothetical protein [Methanoculleus horonobensis]